ncbi:protein YIPF5-like [Gigantopelta aegis]|uniref:protein YIPF5-like n=1 Tax=Gigantopelta aegis TaxID=1735272 RepID=UPI001B888EFA|nr:protein YIPF5-like [Gigantopelta aegis]XP_041360074.1 protein YIPF5-like [Gigantopelta aegis]XP_041360075.1 protein YIPF5-like [Gigantopelta aegis]
MSQGFGQDGGFFQGNYYDQQSSGYDMGGGQAFGQDQQFQQFDYNQGYGIEGQGQMESPQAAYPGSIMTPSTSLYDQAGTASNYEDEPPLMEELGINFDHIVQKTTAVLNPLKVTDHDIMQDTDLAGPLVFCLSFGVSLMLAGKLQFGYIYGIGVVGCLAMYALLNLMSMTGVSVGCTISVLGYCLLPMVILSFSSVVLSLQGILGIVFTVITVLWCSLSASKLFVSALAMDQQQFLVAYPCALVYGVFALLTVF